MIKNRIIAGFILCLMLVINWHNALFHSHNDWEGKPDNLVHTHEHDQAHHHHHHAPSGFLNWLTEFFGDLEHSDLGEDHFQIFIHPQQQTGSDQTGILSPPASPVISTTISFRTWFPLKENDIPDRVQSFSDPPFLDAVANRGPPSFS